MFETFERRDLGSVSGGLAVLWGVYLAGVAAFLLFRARNGLFTPNLPVFVAVTTLLAIVSALLLAEDADVDLDVGQ